MVGFAVSFDFGRYHATAWGAHVNEATVEWPPSPWRLLRAVLSASHTNVGLAEHRADLERALARLANAPPPHFDLPPVGPGHTRHYVPLSSHSPTRRGETSLLVDAFHAIDPSAELRVWWRADLDERARAALARAAEAVGYLGRSESVCSMRLLSSGASEEPDALPASEAPGADGWDHVDLLTVAPNADEPIAVLGTSVTDLRHRRLRTPPGTRTVAYAVKPTWSLGSKVPPLPAERRPTVAHLRIVGGQRPALTDAVTVGNLLRSAVQKQFGALSGGGSSRVLSGHGHRGMRLDQHAHAHYLSLPGPDGLRIDSMVVWAPEGLGPDEVAAIARLRQLRFRDIPDPVRVGLVALGRPDDVPLARVLGEASTWRSLTPFLLNRHPKRRGGRLVDDPVDQVLRELSLRGFPPPADVGLETGPWMRFKRARPRGSLRQVAPVVGVRLRFDEPLPGPIALGGLSHFGLGLFGAERS